jgi:DNA-binding LacI/PurR family transcriptional regulator
LSSVDRCNQDVAENVTEMLLNRVKNPKLKKQHKLLEMEFIYRESAG